MKHRVLTVIVGAILLIVLSACSSGGTATQSGAECPTPGEGTLLFTIESQGYCLLYPSTHTPVENSASQTSFVVGDLMNHTDPRFSVTVTDAAGASTSEAAAAVLADYGLPEMSTEESVTLGGEEAIMLDNMPGQDINRRVIVVHNDRIYDLMFTPVGPDYGETGQQTEAVYQQVIDSFTFLP